MKMLVRAAFALSALLMCAPTSAVAVSACALTRGDGTCVPDVASVSILPAATSTPLAGTPAVGTTTLGPFVPQLGRDIWILIKGTWAGTISVGTSPATDNCATIFNPLTVAGSTWASFTANANETVSTPTRGATPAGVAAPVYCVKSVITSGAPTVELRQ